MNTPQQENEHNHGHAHGQNHRHGMAMDDVDWSTVVMDREFWNDRYAQSETIWSGNPNPQLVAEIGETTHGSALDVGCGEGADAIWLADRGWTVTAIDISTVALDRARQRAGDRTITFSAVDLTAEPAPGTFHLVSAHFFHLQEPGMTTALSALGDAVAPGGTLLVVGHHPADEMSLSGHKAHREMLRDEHAIAAFYTGSSDTWTVEVCEARRRDARFPDGTDTVTTDAVVRLRKN